MLIVLKLLANTVVRRTIIFAPMFAIALVVPVPGPWWVAWILGLAVAWVVGHCLLILLVAIEAAAYVKYINAHPISEEDLEAARLRVAAAEMNRMNHWR